MWYRHVFSDGKAKGKERQPSKRQAERQKAKQRARAGQGGGGGLLEAIRGGSPAHHKAPLHFVKGMVIHAHVSRPCCHHLHITTKILMQQQQPLQSAFGILCGHRHSFAISRVVSTFICRQVKAHILPEDDRSNHHLMLLVKREEKNVLFSDQNGSLLGQQPRV